MRLATTGWAAFLAIVLAAGIGGCVDGRDWDWGDDRYRGRGDRDRYEDYDEDRDRYEDDDRNEDRDDDEDRDHHENQDRNEDHDGNRNRNLGRDHPDDRDDQESQRGPAGRPRP